MGPWPGLAHWPKGNWNLIYVDMFDTRRIMMDNVSASACDVSRRWKLCTRYAIIFLHV